MRQNIFVYTWKMMIYLPWFYADTETREVSMPDINPQNIKELRALVEQQLQYTLCVSLNKATHGDIFNAVALAIRHFNRTIFVEPDAAT